MIYGVGIDLIETKRIERELEKPGDRFRESVFTPREIAYCTSRKSRSARCQCFAGRFSAKEAFFKAIGTGLRDGLRWQDVEVSNDERGKPSLVLRNMALEIVERENITDVRLSISHTGGAATAIVILGT
jgi:holo-[acyl-carrier protein] synthase